MSEGADVLIEATETVRAIVAGSTADCELIAEFERPCKDNGLALLL